jgi:bifunctional DNA-binding transcriptional regulator/antitoxin component of YhaV-PrlF toxin-antitoxin module
MRIRSKGQVTILIEVREKMGLLPNTEVEFQIQGNVVRLKKKAGSLSRRPRDLIHRMRKKATVEMTTDEILALTRG